MCCTSTGTDTVWIQKYIAKLLFQEASNTCGLHLFMTIDLLDRIFNCLEKEVDNSSKWNSKSTSQYLLNHGPGRPHIGKCPADQPVPLSNSSLLLSTHLHPSLLSTHHSKTGGKDAIPVIWQPQGIPARQPWTNDKNGGSWSAYFFRLPPSLCPKMREVPSIAAWVNCFRQYLAILAESEVESCALRALIHPRTNPKPCNMPALSTFPSYYSKGKRQGPWVQFPIASSGTEGNAQGKCVDIDTPATQAQGTTMPQSAKDWGRLNL